MRKGTQMNFLEQVKTRIRFFILLILTLLPLGAALHATTLARLTLNQLATAADAVARVRCVSAVSEWENGSIWTVTTFDVVETIKGNLPAQVTVSLPGGRVGHLTAMVDGTPKFTPGGSAIVFLERSRVGGFSVAGWVEGTFRLARDPRTGRETVTQDSSAFEVFDPATRSFLTEGIRQMPVEEFRARVAQAIARPQGKNQ
jgi:hypothetical protein